MLVWILGPNFVERASILHQPDGLGSQRRHIVTYGELNDVLIALVARVSNEAVTSSAVMRILKPSLECFDVVARELRRHLHTLCPQFFKAAYLTYHLKDKVISEGEGNGTPLAHEEGRPKWVTIISVWHKEYVMR
ncbi:hypothetical protein Tco_1396093 [Tanacetum coccineum]